MITDLGVLYGFYHISARQIQSAAKYVCKSSEEVNLEILIAENQFQPAFLNGALLHGR